MAKSVSKPVQQQTLSVEAVNPDFAATMQQIAAQRDDANTNAYMKAVLAKLEQQVVRDRIKELAKEVKVLRALLPKREKKAH